MYKQGAKLNPASVASAAASLLFLLPLSAGASDLLRRTLLSLLQVFLNLFFVLLSLLPSPVHPIPIIPTTKHVRSSPGSTCASRALSHLLSVVSLVPVSSRKYEIVRSLADRLLDENSRFDAELNRRVLADAFDQTVSRLEATVAAGEWGIVGGAVKKGMKRWWPAVMASGMAGEEAFDGAKAEKLAAELIWIGERMEAFGAVGDAVVRWGAATGLGQRAISTDARLQVALVRVTVFLLKHANMMESEEESKGAAEGQERSISHICMEILKSWVPLLCHTSNGTETPTLTIREKAETVRVLEELIAKLSWEQQEEVLALWLHHFAACADSDWPNLESCYAQWYSSSRKLITY